MVRRLDFAALRATRTPQGFLRGDARVTRVGVFTYLNADGSKRREYRPHAEVFKADSLKTLALIPITNGHPSDGEPVTADNAQSLSVGAVGDHVREDGRFVVAPYVVHDGAAIKDIDDGKRELSCGYNCRLDWTSGTHDGQPYDCVQRDIVYNHLAIVTRGRAGPEVRIDGEDALCVDAYEDDNNARDDARNGVNVKIKIKGIEFDVPDQAAQAIEAERSDHATVLDAVKTEATKATARADQLDADCKKLREDHAPAKIASLVKSRVALETKARSILGEDFKTDELDDNGLRAAVVKKITPSANLDGKDAGYITARYDQAIESYEVDEEREDAATDSQADVRRALDAKAHEDNADEGDSDTAHAAMVKRNRDAWKNKPANA